MLTSVQAGEGVGRAGLGVQEKKAVSGEMEGPAKLKGGERGPALRGTEGEQGGREPCPPQGGRGAATHAQATTEQVQAERDSRGEDGLTAGAKEKFKGEGAEGST